MSADKFLRMLSTDVQLGYDVETEGLNWKTQNVCGYSLSDSKDAVYVSVRHKGGANIDQPEAFEAEVNKIIQQRKKPLVGWNIKFDAHFSENHDIILGNNIVDGMVMEALLDENKHKYDLKSTLPGYNIEHKSDKALYAHIGAKFGCKPDRSSMAHFHRLSGDDPFAVGYACDDTRTTLQCYEKQYKELYRQELDLVADLENKLCHVLQKMERRGIQVDEAEAARVKLEVDELYERAYLELPLEEAESGEVKFINIRSGKDLKEYFEMCSITDWPMTAPTERFPNGQPSFNKQFLATSQEGLNILNCRKYGHLKNSFLDVLDSHIHKGRIHTTFNQTKNETHGTKTGRLSSSNPNKQQVPKRDKELGKIYRRMFISSPDCILIEYDYSQAEPRLYSHYSGEPVLIQGYTSTPVIDMHSVAAQYMNVSRDVAKNLNLGIMYTMGADKLAAQLGITREAALDILKRWKRTFPNVAKFTKRASQVAEERGYVKTILGRRARFPDARWSYRAANRIIQGGSADIMKWKLVEIDRYLVENNLEDVCKMLLTIHDSIVFEIHKSRMDLIKIIASVMERVQVPPFNLKVPFTVDYNHGQNWSAATYNKAA